MTARRLTERQYELLRSYEAGLPSWRPGGISGTLNRLVSYGHLRHVREGFYEITEDGKAALVDFRARYGLPVGV